MVDYRRNRVLGGMFFFTVTLRNRRSDVLVRHVHALRASWRVARSRNPHEVVAAVILPEHLHAVLQMTVGSDYSRLWQDLKKYFTRRIADGGPSPWQSRFWEHTIRDAGDLRRHVDYVHINPIKHGWASRLGDWPHSSFHRYVREGVLAADWAGEVEEDDFGK